MQIEFTNRIIKKLIDLKQNVTDSSNLFLLEPSIDGGKIQGNDIIKTHQARELLKEYSSSHLGISPELFDCSIPKISVIDSVDFLLNPYLKNITLPSFQTESLTLEMMFYEINELALVDESNRTSNLNQQLSIGIFDGPAYTYVLRNNDFVWMSICPMEINSMKKPIAEANGRVLVLGGGLAYYPYMVSLKQNVSEITIIESNPEVYDLIKNTIIPQFPNKKVRIVLADALEYVKENSLSTYDTVFFDIWENNISGAEYLKKIAFYELKYPNIKFQYWLETSILDTYIVNILEYFNAKVGSPEYQDFYKRVAPDIWCYMESISDTIKRPDQLDYYLSRKFAKDYLIHSISL